MNPQRFYLIRIKCVKKTVLQRVVISDFDWINFEKNDIKIKGKICFKSLKI